MLRRLHYELRYLLNKAPWDSGISPPELCRFLDDHPPGRAIDLGCGTGTNVITLAQHGWQTVGIDLASSAIMTARRKAQQAEIEATFLQGSVLSLVAEEAIKGPYDLALDIGCLHALDEGERPGYLRQVASLIAPGGTYLLYSFLQLPQSDPGRWPTEAEIRDLLTGELKAQEVEHGSFRNRASAWFTIRRTD